jgi:Barstar (barnase inhibitor)
MVEERPVFIIKFAPDDLSSWDKFYEASAEKLRFGGYFGRNKDAWQECAGDIDREDSARNGEAFPADARVVLSWDTPSSDYTIDLNIVSFIEDSVQCINAERGRLGQPIMLECSAAEPTGAEQL